MDTYVYIYICKYAFLCIYKYLNIHIYIYIRQYLVVYQNIVRYIHGYLLKWSIPKIHRFQNYNDSNLDSQLFRSESGGHTAPCLNS